MITSKKEQICGLVGEKLSHSHSPLIHSCLANYSYSLFELSPDELGSFIRSNNYHSVNVTIPYKVAVMQYLDVISEQARRIGSVNTVTHLPDGRLFGDNTDYYGFVYMLKRAGIDIKDKHVVILGSGGASKTAVVACQDMGAASVYICSRTGRINYGNIREMCKHTDVIVNCTPVGMYPNNGDSPLSLDSTFCPEAVVDLIFNPSKTQLLLDAERYGIKYTNGLPMLVAQAKRACEIFTGESIDDGEIEKIIKQVSIKTQNIILIGMPGCGKTTVGRLISEKLGRPLLDTDEMITEAAGKSIPELFAQYGEEHFRRLEHDAVTRAGKHTGVVIATGGGVPTFERNIPCLRQNGCIFFLQRDTDQLDRGGRPLSASADLEKMLEIRLPHYRSAADLEVQNVTPADTAKQIIDAFTAR